MSFIVQHAATFYTYDIVALEKILHTLLYAHAPNSESWLDEKAQTLNEPKSNALAVAFAAMPRKVDKELVAVDDATSQKINALIPGFSIAGWPVSRLGRVWLLLQIDALDKEAYIRRIESLFPAAEMNELVALYSALPLLAYPEAWRARCAEGIRSNIGPVLESIMCRNPYPSAQLDEKAWNQLVLKAFFTEKRVDEIIGLDERANADLAKILLDFAHERWAAGRTAPPLLWRCVAPFLNAGHMPDLEKVFRSPNLFDRQAAALAAAQTSFGPAKDLLQTNADLRTAIESGTLTWASLAERVAAAQA